MATLKLATVAGKVRFHCTMVGRLPAVEAKDRFKVTVPPAVVLPEDNVREDCAKRELHSGKKNKGRKIRPENRRIFRIFDD